jgi:hypothetical protein
MNNPKLYDGESMISLLHSAHGKFKSRLKGVVISRKQAEMWARHIEDGCFLAKVSVLNPLKYVSSLRPNMAAVCMDVKLAPVAYLWNFQGVPVFIKDMAAPPIILVEGKGAFIWEGRDDA